jgi:hypothetical protein
MQCVQACYKETLKLVAISFVATVSLHAHPYCTSGGVLFFFAFLSKYVGEIWQSLLKKLMMLTYVARKQLLSPSKCVVYVQL